MRNIINDSILALHNKSGIPERMYKMEYKNVLLIKKENPAFISRTVAVGHKIV